MSEQELQTALFAMIDMDGVVADFDTHILSTYGKPMGEMSAEQKNRFWEIDCVDFSFFAHSPPIEEGLSLVQSLQSAGVDISFLTSTGGGVNHAEIAKQKLSFLSRHGMGHLPVAFATGTACKANYARPGIVLIDDREKVVNAFRERGGVAYLFTPGRWQEISDTVIQGC